MDRRFTIPQVENARDYLLDFEPEIQQRGRALWQGRAVAELLSPS